MIKTEAANLVWAKEGQISSPVCKGIIWDYAFIYVKKMDPYTNFCSKRMYIVFYSDILFYIYKSEMYCIL